MYIPCYQEIIDDSILKYNDVLYSFLKSRHPNLIDLRNEFLQRGMNKNSEIFKYYWQKDGHLNSDGYKILAEILHKNL